jgi:hypothetical protein
MFKKLISAIFKKKESEDSDFVREKFNEFIKMYKKIEEDIDQIILTHEFDKMKEEELVKFNKTIEESINELQEGLSFCQFSIKNHSKAVLLKNLKYAIKEMKKSLRNLLYYQKSIRTIIKYGCY